jgi:hypothetical protein
MQISFDDLKKHFGSTYGIDLYNVNPGQATHYDSWLKKHRIKKSGDIKHQQDTYTRYIEADDGSSACPPYFDFWHFLIAATKDIEWKTSSNLRRKVVNLPSVEHATEMASRAFDTQARVIAMAKEMGADPRRMALPSLGQEAVDILQKIEHDFGKNVQVIMEVGR